LKPGESKGWWQNFEHGSTNNMQIRSTKRFCSKRSFVGGPNFSIVVVFGNLPARILTLSQMAGGKLRTPRLEKRGFQNTPTELVEAPVCCCKNEAIVAKSPSRLLARVASSSW
jgi:hypothetical protein